MHTENCMCIHNRQAHIQFEFFKMLHLRHGVACVRMATCTNIFTVHWQHIFQEFYVAYASKKSHIAMANEGEKTIVGT